MKNLVDLVCSSPLSLYLTLDSFDTRLFLISLLKFRQQARLLLSVQRGECWVENGGKSWTNENKVENVVCFLLFCCWQQRRERTHVWWIYLSLTSNQMRSDWVCDCLAEAKWSTKKTQLKFSPCATEPKEAQKNSKTNTNIPNAPRRNKFRSELVDQCVPRVEV